MCSLKVPLGQKGLLARNSMFLPHISSPLSPIPKGMLYPKVTMLNSFNGFPNI